MYAVIQKDGHQFKVTPGEKLIVDHIPIKEGSKIDIKETLLLVDNGKVRIGQPFLPNVKVTLKVIKHYKGEKLRVVRFKAKSRYRRVKGFKPNLTELVVESIK